MVAIGPFDPLSWRSSASATGRIVQRQSGDEVGHPGRQGANGSWKSMLSTPLEGHHHRGLRTPDIDQYQVVHIVAYNQGVVRVGVVVVAVVRSGSDGR